jgi:predicted RNA-binding protein YlqC (UPF0109 family)
MDKLLKYILDSIVGKNNYEIEESEDEARVTYQIKSAPSDIGLIIGKGGRTIKAIQNIVRVKARLESKAVFISVSEET